MHVLGKREPVEPLPIGEVGKLVVKVMLFGGTWVIQTRVRN